MQDPAIEEVLQPLRESVKRQDEHVENLKKNGSTKDELVHALMSLKLKKKALKNKVCFWLQVYPRVSRTFQEEELLRELEPFDRFKMEDLLKRRFFYDQSFSIYGGIAGLYDYGPVGCAMKANIIQLWRRHFILEDSMLEVDCSMLTPEAVLRASGHVERFCDYMVKDKKTDECFRADHLIKAHLEKKLQDGKVNENLKKEYEDLDGFTWQEMQAVIEKYGMKSPVTGNDLSEPLAFNLMFPTSIGPTGLVPGYLRPETAQGIFVNFKRLLQFNQGKLPFAAAQIGTGFRNEISPRQGLIRVREFTMAEVEHFVDPANKQHPKFKDVQFYEIPLFSACGQLSGGQVEVYQLKEAVSTGLINNETLGYYMARVHQFLLMVGVDPKKLRFRQHLSNEMAHYATDCWDAECHTSHGWIECVGIADRSCYDLLQHSKATGVKLVAEKHLATPKKVTGTRCVPDKRAIGMQYRGDAASVLKYLEAMSEEECTELADQLDKAGTVEVNCNGKCFNVTKEMCRMEPFSKIVHVEEFVPSVIEPSFGIGRIMYAVCEHSFRTRKDDEQRTYLALPAVVAPYKCSILPLSAHSEFQPFIQRLSTLLTELNVSHKIDDSGGSIGRRYARTDEIAIPFAITIDFDTLSFPHSATLRERDSMMQVRTPLDELPGIINALVCGTLSWEEILGKYPKFVQQESSRRENGA
ncbi:glycyl trna synthetase [Trichuris trichiura]|uniref:Glycine--tRNA ligase n=1 Tax=Trichuris trichiura TaxID=36087 RepID=A0A077Z7C4_TRITR|nr:glycyl trna synthetase [Trichuris trichiura]